MVQRKINRGRHTDHPAGHHSIQANQCPPRPSPYFLQAGCPSCRPTNSVKALKATVTCTFSVPQPFAYKYKTIFKEMKKCPQSCISEIWYNATINILHIPTHTLDACIVPVHSMVLQYQLTLVTNHSTAA